MKIAYDFELDRPGCAIVQAALGGDSSSCHPFDANTWLTAPTPGMRVFEASPDQVAEAVIRVNQRVRSQGRRGTERP